MRLRHSSNCYCPLCEQIDLLVHLLEKERLRAAIWKSVAKKIRKAKS